MLACLLIANSYLYSISVIFLFHKLLHSFAMIRNLAIVIAEHVIFAEARVSVSLGHISSFIL